MSSTKSTKATPPLPAVDAPIEVGEMLFNARLLTTEESIVAFRAELQASKHQVAQLQEQLEAQDVKAAEKDEQIAAMKRDIGALRAILHGIDLHSPKDAQELAATLGNYSDEVFSMTAARKQLGSLQQSEEKLRMDTERMQQQMTRVLEDAATMRAALQQLTTEQRGQALQVRQVQKQVVRCEGQRKLVVFAAAVVTVQGVAAALAQSLHCAEDAIARVELNTQHAAPISRDRNRDPRSTAGPPPPSATGPRTPATGAAPPRRLVFVVTMKDATLVDLALKGRQCRAAMKDRGMKLDDWLTPAELQKRDRMRPIMKHLQNEGIVAVYRGTEVFQLVPAAPAAPGAHGVFRQVERPAAVRAADIAAAEAEAAAAAGGQRWAARGARGATSAPPSGRESMDGGRGSPASRGTAGGAWGAGGTRGGGPPTAGAAASAALAAGATPAADQAAGVAPAAAAAAAAAPTDAAAASQSAIAAACPA